MHMRLTWMRHLTDESYLEQGVLISTEFDRDKYKDSWNLMCDRSTPVMCDVLSDVYYRVLQHYQATFHAVPLHIISRIFNKRWAAALQAAELPPVPLLNALMGASLSNTMPLMTGYNEKGGTVLLPFDVFHTYHALNTRNKRIDKKLETGLIEPLSDYNEIMCGLAEGPRIRGNGLKRAEAPFLMKPVSVTYDDKIDTSDVIDT